MIARTVPAHAADFVPEIYHCVLLHVVPSLSVAHDRNNERDDRNNERDNGQNQIGFHIVPLCELKEVPRDYPPLPGARNITTQKYSPAVPADLARNLPRSA